MKERRYYNIENKEKANKLARETIRYSGKNLKKDILRIKRLYLNEESAEKTYCITC